MPQGRRGRNGMTQETPTEVPVEPQPSMEGDAPVAPTEAIPETITMPDGTIGFVDAPGGVVRDAYDNPLTTWPLPKEVSTETDIDKQLADTEDTVIIVPHGDDFVFVDKVSGVIYDTDMQPISQIVADPVKQDEQVDALASGEEGGWGLTDYATDIGKGLYIGPSKAVAGLTDLIYNYVSVPGRNALAAASEYALGEDYIGRINTGDVASILSSQAEANVGGPTESVAGNLTEKVAQFAYGAAMGGTLLKGVIQPVSAGLSETVASGALLNKVVNAATVAKGTEVALTGLAGIFIGSVPEDRESSFLAASAGKGALDLEDRMVLAAEDMITLGALTIAGKGAKGVLDKLVTKVAKNPDKMARIAALSTEAAEARNSPAYRNMSKTIEEEVPQVLQSTKMQFYRQAARLRKMIEKTDEVFFTTDDPRLTELWDVIQRMPPKEGSEALAELQNIVRRPKGPKKAPSPAARADLRRRAQKGESRTKGKTIEQKLLADKEARQEALAMEKAKKLKEAQLNRLVNKLIGAGGDIKVEVTHAAPRSASKKAAKKATTTAPRAKPSFGFPPGTKTLQEAEEWLANQMVPLSNDGFEAASKTITKGFLNAVGEDPDNIDAYLKSTWDALIDARKAVYGPEATAPRSLKDAQANVSKTLEAMAKNHDVDPEKYYEYITGQMKVLHTVADQYDSIDEAMVAGLAFADNLKGVATKLMDEALATGDEALTLAAKAAYDQYTNALAIIEQAGSALGRGLSSRRRIGRAATPNFNFGEVLEGKPLKMTVRMPDGTSKVIQGQDMLAEAKKQLASLIKGWDPKERLHKLYKKVREGKITPKEAGKVIQGRLVSYYLGNIFSGPKTLIGNMVSGALQVTLLPAEKALAGLAKGKKDLLVEAAAELTGTFGAIQDAMVLAKVNWQTGVNPFRGVKFETAGQKGWSTWVFRILESTDVAIQAARTRGVVKGKLAKGYGNKLANEGKQEAERWLETQWKEFVDNPLKLIPDGNEAYLMNQEARLTTFTHDMPKGLITDLTRTAEKYLNRVPMLRTIAPVIGIGVRMAREGIHHVPVLGLLGHTKRLWDEGISLGKMFKGPAGERLLGQQLSGLVASTGTVGLWSQDLITGSGPAFGTAERRAWEESGKRPNSIKTPMGWIEYKYMEPLATVLTLTCDTLEAWKSYSREYTDEEATEHRAALAMNLFKATMVASTDKTFWPNFRDLITATSSDPGAGSALNRWAQNTAGGMIPFSGALKQVTDVINPEVRKHKEWLNRVLLSRSLVAPPNTFLYDLHGKKVVNGLFNMGRFPVSDSPTVVQMEMAEHLGAPFPSEKESLNGIPLSDVQRSEWQRLLTNTPAPSGKIKGKKLGEALTELINSDKYQEMKRNIIADAQQGDPSIDDISDIRQEFIANLPTTAVLKSVVNAYQELAREELFKLYPDLKARYGGKVTATAAVKGGRPGLAASVLREIDQYIPSGKLPTGATEEAKKLVEILNE